MGHLKEEGEGRQAKEEEEEEGGEGGGGGSFPSSCTTSPMTMVRRETDEADRSQ